MLFWLAILAGLVGAIAGASAGLHQMVAVMVNLLIGGYVAIFLTGTLIQAVPAALEIPSGGLLATAMVAIGTVLLLQGIYATLFPASYKITFPRLLDLLSGGGIGFLAGFFAIALACTLVCTTIDIKDVPFVSQQSVQTHRQFVCWWVDHIHRIVGVGNSPQDTMDALQTLSRLTQAAGAAPKPNLP